MSRRKRRGLHELPIRRSAYGERCLICLHRIVPGDIYRDGGHGRRAHLGCAQAVREGHKREPTRAEARQLEDAESDASKAKGAVYGATQRALCGLTDHMRAAVELLEAAEQHVEDLKQLWAEPEGEDD